MNVRDISPLPFFAGVGGVVLLLGTVVGQSGHGDVGGSYDPMAGMNMGPGGGGSSSTSSSMPGMNMGAGNAFTGSGSTSGAASSSSTMPGMSMEASGSTGAGTMSMPDGSTMAAAAMPTKPMNMADPHMAAQMPGGLHSTCAGDTCTVIFADKATGVAKVLGTTAKLDSAKAKQIVLTVGKKQLTLRQGKPVTDGKLRIELTSSSAGEYTVKFTKSH